MPADEVARGLSAESLAAQPSSASDGAAQCWTLTAPGESCVDACGSEPATDVPMLLSSAASPVVVRALAAHYGVAERMASQTAGQPCGRAAPDEGLQMWVSRLWPFWSAEWRAIYLYMPLDAMWDCYEGQTFLNVGDAFRSPCLCQPPPVADLMGGLWTGLVVGAVLPPLLLIGGVTWDNLESNGCLSDTWKVRGRPSPSRQPPPRPRSPPP